MGEGRPIRSQGIDGWDSAEHAGLGNPIEGLHRIERFVVAQYCH